MWDVGKKEDSPKALRRGIELDPENGLRSEVEDLIRKK